MGCYLLLNCSVFKHKRLHEVISELSWFVEDDLCWDNAERKHFPARTQRSKKLLYMHEYLDTRVPRVISSDIFDALRLLEEC